MKKFPKHEGAGPSPTLALTSGLNPGALGKPPNRMASRRGNPADTEVGGGGWAGPKGSLGRHGGGKPGVIWDQLTTQELSMLLSRLCVSRPAMLGASSCSAPAPGPGPRSRGELMSGVEAEVGQGGDQNSGDRCWL